MANEIVDKYGNPTQNNIDEIADLNKRILAVENTQKNTIKTYKRVIGFLIAIGVISIGTASYVCKKLTEAKDIIIESETIIDSTRNGTKDLLKEINKCKEDIVNVKSDIKNSYEKVVKLTDSIDSIQKSANKAEECNLKTHKIATEAQEAAENSQKVSDDIKLLYKDIISAQKNLEIFIAKNTTYKQPKQFTVKVSGSYGNYTISSGNGIAYDREISGSTTNNFIIVPKESVLIIEDSGSTNTFNLKQDVIPRVIIKGNGRYRSIKTIK